MKELHPFDWHARFPEVFAQGGFDAVVGNPPYVRQEWLGQPLKEHLATRFAAYHGMADLYVYFYERALQVLRPGGRLAYIVTNKWMKSGYGEPLRRLFSEGAWVESVVDFGHAKQFFKDADVFPCFLVARKPDDSPPPIEVTVCVIPRELVKLDELGPLVAARGMGVARERLTSDTWNLEPVALNDLIDKIRRNGVALSEYAECSPLMGIKTGYNEAFLVDTETKDRLVKADPKSVELFKPYLRGQDIERWRPEWAGLWMIAIKSSGDHPWPWADRGDDAEATFAATYPALFKHFNRFKPELVKRQDQGRYWWELRSCAYWDEFAKPKITYQEIQFHPRYALDPAGRLANNKAFFIVSDDPFLLGVLNSPLFWWHNWRYLPHMKDEALSPVAYLMESLPIATPSDAIRIESDTVTRRLIAITDIQQLTRRMFLDWLNMEYDVERPTTRLLDPVSLDGDAFVAEVKKSRGKGPGLSSAALLRLRDEYAQVIVPARPLVAEALALETRLSDLVNAAYGLTPDEVRLIWETAPPRMPIPDPIPRADDAGP